MNMNFDSYWDQGGDTYEEGDYGDTQGSLSSLNGNYDGNAVDINGNSLSSYDFSNDDSGYGGANDQAGAGNWQGSDWANGRTPTWGEQLGTGVQNAASTLGGWLSNPNQSMYGKDAQGVQKGMTPKNIFGVGSALFDYLQTRKASADAIGYQNQLKNLMNNPSSLSSIPAYQFAQKNAMEAARRQAAANGQLKSGNLMAALQDRSNNVASTWYNQEANRLGQLSAGANAGRVARGDAGLKTASELMRVLGGG
jgi:hypothetical protein